MTFQRFLVVFSKNKDNPLLVAYRVLKHSDLGKSLQHVALGFGSDLRVSLREVAPASVLSSVSSKERATSGRRSNVVAPRGKAQRLHRVAAVRSLRWVARPLITLNTSFELQMHPNVSNNSM
ncbi:hypothetical protein IGI04_012962 [Brassica rapa subsp. trilocularis]|uniref:Uncharacterized protein n=1 Tax=Brassica rapa subsp. trilocularis TaxID=1813537 RepID=A0ABQ7N834_BRACM|nr:hypothetical protein IGI04_012962 [Brassica rapa subsp. trilocularis]